MQNNEIPRDILDKANELYPKPDRSDYHTDLEYEMSIGHNDSDMRDTYIKTRLDERQSMFEFMEWVRTETINVGTSYMLRYKSGSTELFTLQQLHAIWQSNK